MRILLHDCSGHPFQLQLARWLAGQGHRTHHVHCASFASGHGAVDVRPDDPDTFTTGAIDLGGSFEKYRWSRRLLGEVRYGRALERELAAFGPDVVISCNDPLFTKAIGARWCRRNRTPWLFWLQDFFHRGMADAAVDALGPAGRLPGALFRRVEAGLLASASHVVAITEDFVDEARNMGVEAGSLTVIENWAPIDELPPRPRRNAWSTKHDLDDVVVFLYAGTLGKKHDPNLLLELAAAVDGKAVVMVVSEGPIVDELAATGVAIGQANLRVLGFQDWDDVPDMLGSADVLVVLLEPSAGTYSVPSKVLTSLCAGRAVLASMPPENLAARMLTSSGAGVVVAGSERSAFADAASRLATDVDERTRRGEAARRHAESAFDIERIGPRFESILAGMVPSR